MDTVENVETAKKIIEVTVRDRVATHIGDDFYVCGNTEYEIHFDFDEEWDALDIKTARFIADGNVLYPDRIFSGNVCSFPDNPPISNTTSVRVGVFAGNLHTTTPARIPAVKSILCGTSTPAAPDEDAYHEAMEEMAKVATDARAQAEASAKSAEASAKSAEESAQSAVEADASAQDSAKAAETSRQHSTDANAQAQAAAKSASDAASSASDAEAAKRAASAQADDAEESAKDAQTWAGRSEAFAGNAAASANKAGEYAAASAESAQAAASSATAASDSAKASAQSAVDAAESVKDVFIVHKTTNDAGKFVADKTPEEIAAAAASGKMCILVRDGVTYTYIGLMRNLVYTQNGECHTFVTMYQRDGVIKAAYQHVSADGTLQGITGTTYTPNPNKLILTGGAEAKYDGSEAVNVKIPATLPNPHKLTLTGGAEAEYDGSSAVSVEVPDVFVVKVDRAGKSDHTKQEIVGAAMAGKACVLVASNGQVYQYSGLTTHDGVSTIPVFRAAVMEAGGMCYKYKMLVLDDCETYFTGDVLYASNPQALRFKGAVEAVYNGSKAVTVEIPAGGSGGAGLPETADPLKQLVTDESGKVGWEERLAYKQTAQVVNLAATELTGIDDDGDGTNEAHVLLSPWAADVVPGSVTTVTYNGTDYECQAIDYALIEPDAPAGMSAMGNVAAMGVEGIEGGNADAPFLLIAVPNAAAESDMGGMYGMLMAIDGAATVTIAVSSVVAKYKTIDKPYLPKQEALTFTGASEEVYDGSRPVSVEIPTPPTIPTALPNPKKLTFTGAVSASYDGSGAVTVNIPKAQSIPTPSSSDAGKFLRVNSSGAYVLEAIASAEEANF